MKWLFVGPNLLSGIGQVTRGYASLVNGEYVVYSEGTTPSQDKYDICFAFVLPLRKNLEYIDSISHLCDRIVYMTVCETQTVHQSYSSLVQCKPMYVPSQFAKERLEAQFPEMECKVLHHWARRPRVHKFLAPFVQVTPESPYIFYTIGNILDARKNLRGIVQAFKACNFPNARLLLKATCAKPVTITVPNVAVINGLVSEDHLDKIHDGCHCYINASHSEGVGMGAVEAAVRNKPIIIADYGGLKEYVKTPYVIPCKLDKIGFDDFLFKKDMEWGHPSIAHLVAAMKDCYNKRLGRMNHAHTKNLITEVQNTLENIAQTEL